MDIFFAAKKFLERDLRLLSKEYIGSKIKMEYECLICGYKGLRKWNDFQQGVGCRVCSYKKRGEARRIDFSTVVDEFYARGFILVSTSYKNKSTPLKYVCSKGHETQISYDHLKGGEGCLTCGFAATKQKLTRPFSEVVKIFEERGYQVLSGEEEYENSHSKIKFICDKGHEDFISICHFTGGHGCEKCGSISAGKKRRLSIDVVRKEFASRGFELLTDDYIGYYVKMPCKCEKGHLVNMSIAQMKRDVSCSVCYNNSFSKASQDWLDYLGVPDVMGKTREVSIPGTLFRADGFDPETKTIYEYYGDFWHGNPDFFSREEINHVNKKTMGCLYDELLERERILKEMGYTIIYIWHSEWKKESRRIRDGSHVTMGEIPNISNN